MLGQLLLRWHVGRFVGRIKMVTMMPLKTPGDCLDGEMVKAPAFSAGDRCLSHDRAMPATERIGTLVATASDAFQCRSLLGSCRPALGILLPDELESLVYIFYLSWPS